MALRLWRQLYLSAVVTLLLVANNLAADTSGTNDVSDVLFASDNVTGLVCTEAVPENIEIATPYHDSVTITWDRPNVTGTFKYQVLYWEVTTTTYQCTTNLTQTSTVLSGLSGLAIYSVAVRLICPEDLLRPGPASSIHRFSTSARAPSGFPVVSDVTTCYNGMCDIAVVTWNHLPVDQWNGLQLFYEVYNADVTPGDGQNGPTTRVYYPGTNLTLGNLQLNHDYIVSVRAVSSGGLGPIDVPTVFSVDVPTVSTQPSPQLLESWWIYLLIFGGGAILLAIFLTLIIICIKKCVNKKGVVYARDISKNIQDGRIPMNSFGSLMRADQVRLSHRGRPLPAQPAHPLQHTPSTTSMNAHLLKESTSPQYPPMSAGMAFELEQFPPRKLPHPGGLPKLEADSNRFGHVNVQSPPFPQLYQPFSDLSSATSSVFTESNIQHDLDPRQVSSSGPSSAANPYEVPADSETGHPSVSGHPSISPPAHMNTLPSPRRPHTAAAMLASQPAFPPAPSHHPPPLTQSSLELFHGTHPAPPIPPHQINSSVGQLHSSTPMEEWKQDLAKLAAADPTDADYSEVPSGSPESSVRANQVHSRSMLQPQQTAGIPRMPSMERGSALPSYGHESSLMSSDQYSSYSDIPHVAVGKEKGELLDPKLYQGPIISSHPGQFVRSSSMSDSISSFSSDDDDDEQSKPPRYNNRQLDSNRSGEFLRGRSESISSASNTNNNNSNTARTGTFPRNAKMGLQVPQDSPLPTPYLSPASLMS